MITDTQNQLDQYGDALRIAEAAQQVAFKRLILVYRGGESFTPRYFLTGQNVYRGWEVARQR